MNDNLIYYDINDVYNVKLHGRIDSSLDVIPLMSNGQGIELNATGSELWVDIDADYDFMEPWAAIEINGDMVSRFMIDRGEQTICLYRGIQSGRTTRVKFYRELQAMSEDPKTRIVIKGLHTDGTFMAPPYYERKLEFIGDSITSGEGTYGAPEDEDWAAYCMSYSRTYINLTCKELNAESHVISQGGWGVFSGWDNDRRHVIRKYYEQQCGLAFGDENKKYGADKPYDFASWNPDAVIINLGTNDASAFNEASFTDPESGDVWKLMKNEDGSLVPEDEKRIIKAAIDLIKMIRKDNPSSHIVWMYGMLGYDLSLVISDAINRYKAETHDNNIQYIMLPAINKDTVGARQHPGYKAHEIAARILTDYLKSVLV
ncbi:MAG: GDSL family lipase [Lachnospiraceae bacterium]|nr:GDSL family lipase [Lachnospiraceae bacterium]